MIGIFGATGNVGGAVASALEARGASFKAIVRDVEAAREKIGTDVDLVQGDFEDPAGLDRALSGVDTLFIVCGQHPAVGELETNAIEAAKRTGVNRVVQLSGTEKSLSPDSRSILARQHCAVEATLQASGLDWTLCRPNFFMSNLLASGIAAHKEAFTA